MKKSRKFRYNEEMDNIIALCKRRGFVYPSSDIYGGLANAYDYGPMGAELLRNIRNAWWDEFVQKRTDMVGLDSQIILHPQTWVASGHVSSFNDPLVEDKVTHKRYRADHLIEAWAKKNDKTDLIVENMTLAEMSEYIKENKIKSPDGNEVSEPKPFNQLFETSLGVIAGEKSKVYLRGETAQGIFINFKNVVNSMRVRLPFGIGQIGKSFRNEITTGQFIFRTFELEQAEIEYFFDPDQQDWKELLENWKESMLSFVTKRLGVNKDDLRWRKHTDKERSHYSKETFDLDYHFPFGWKELWGVAYRTNYDLTQHMNMSGKSLEYVNPETGKKIVPHVIEPAVGINRLFFMLLLNAYREEIVNDKSRVYLKLKPELAPIKVAVFPLQKDDTLSKEAKNIYDRLRKRWRSEFDNNGNIGKMYRRQDEIGTPLCVTVDFETANDNSVTVRDRDTMNQTRVKVTDLEEYISNTLQI